jgi:FixJ family two-component response regulator
LKVDVSIHQAKVKIRDARNSGANTRSESGTLVGTLALSRFATMSKHKLLKRLLAAQLGIAERTTKVHRGHLMGKLGVQSIGQLLAMVLRVVLVDK